MAKIAISQEAMHDTLIKELCSGRRFMEELKHKEKWEERIAAKEAQAMRGNKGKTLKFAGSIPASDFFTIRNHQGDGCWDDRGFVKDYFKKHPHLKSANL